MAFETYVGSVATPIVPGTFSVTGLPFQPKIVLFYWGGTTADGAAVNATHGLGAAISSTSRMAVVASDGDAKATSDGGRRHDNTHCYIGCDFAGNLVISADLDSLNSDGFTLDLDNADGAARIINYLALGGTTLTDVFIKEFTAPSTGAQSVAYTGVGFQPDAALFFTAHHPTAGASGSNTAWIGAGFASASGSEGTLNAFDTDSAGAANTAHGMSAAAVILGCSPSATFHKAALTSFDADGFTLNYSVANTHTPRIWAICLKGGNYKVAEIAQKTSTGTQAYTGVGFRPGALFLMSANDATDSDREDHHSLSFGAASSPTNQGSVWGGAVDNVDPTQDDQYLDRSNVIRMMTAGTPSTEAVAHYEHNDADGFTFDWTTADATARNILYMAFGPGSDDAPASSAARNGMLLGVW